MEGVERACDHLLAAPIDSPFVWERSLTGRSSAWLECPLWGREVAGSNPVAPTSRLLSQVLRPGGQRVAVRRGFESCRPAGPTLSRVLTPAASASRGAAGSNTVAPTVRRCRGSSRPRPARRGATRVRILSPRRSDAVAGPQARGQRVAVRRGFESCRPDGPTLSRVLKPAASASRCDAGSNPVAPTSGCCRGARAEPAARYRASTRSVVPRAGSAFSRRVGAPLP